MSKESTTRSAMKLALEALVGVWKGGFSFPHVDQIREAITALREALNASLAEQPAQRTWQGLTDDEMDDCWNKLFGTGNYNRRNVYRAIEAKLKAKNFA